MDSWVKEVNLLLGVLSSSQYSVYCRSKVQIGFEGYRIAGYNPNRFAALIMRIRDTKTTALIFASGKMVCVGSKSEQSSRMAARKYARSIQKLGFAVKFKDFKIHNIVVSCDVKFPIKLERLAAANTIAHGVVYEPELFPGLVYRMKQPKIVLLIFASGKIVIAGAKARDEAYTAFENIYPVLTEFKKIKQWRPLHSKRERYEATRLKVFAC